MKIREFIENNNMTRTQFAYHCKITYNQLHRALYQHSCSIINALKIERYTNGQVTLKDIVSEDIWELIQNEVTPHKP